jgi:hypothetical protein
MMEKCLFHFFSIEFPNILNAKIGFKWIGCVQQSITLFIFLNYPYQEARAFHQVSNQQLL